MFNGVLLYFLIGIISCFQFKELPRYDTIEVIPNTKVYLDISSFEVGQSIYLEFCLDLFFSKEPKDRYTFQIAQVNTKYKDDYTYWSKLPNVTTRNVTSVSKDYTFSWVEIKKEGMNYIFINPPEPYIKFYTFWGNKIIIKNTGGISDREIKNNIINITFPIIFAIILITLIVVICKLRKTNNNKDYPPAFTVLELPNVNNQNNQQNQAIKENIENINDVEQCPNPASPMDQTSVQLIN